MIRLLRRGISTGPLLDLSAPHFVPPPAFLTMDSVGFFTGTYEAMRDVAVVSLGRTS